MPKFPNLEAEMVRRDVSCDDIAECIDVCGKTARNKVKGRAPFTWPEVLAIRRKYFSDIPLDVLFAERAAQASA